MILKRFRLNRHHRKIDDFYGAIVAQSRRAAFYIGYGVRDTMEGASTPLSCTWFCCWRGLIVRVRPRAISGRTYSIIFAAILMPICGKWASGIWPFQNECGSLPRRFMEDRVPILPP